MPSKTQKRKQQRQRQKSRAAAMRGAPSMGPAYAPAAVSRNRGQYTRFGAGSQPGSLCMHTNAAIATVIKGTPSVSTTGALALAGNNPSEACQLNLTHPVRLTTAGAASLDGFITPIFDLIASSFVRYRLKRLVFHYEPQASSTDAQQMVFAFAADPDHPVIWNSSVPSTTDLLSLADSRAFMPWEPWTMDVTNSTDRNTVYYTYSDPSLTIGSFSNRFSDFGVMSIQGATSNSTQVNCGVLYMETELELLEFCPISVTRPAAAKHLSSKLSAAASSSSGGRPALEEDMDRVPTREVRRRCEELVRKIEEISKPDAAFFRAQWPEMIEDHPRQLLDSLKQRFETLC